MRAICLISRGPCQKALWEKKPGISIRLAQLEEMMSMSKLARSPFSWIETVSPTIGKHALLAEMTTWSRASPPDDGDPIQAINKSQEKMIRAFSEVLIEVGRTQGQMHRIFLGLGNGGTEIKAKWARRFAISCPAL